MLHPRSKKTQAAYDAFKHEHQNNIERLHVLKLSDEKVIREFTHWVIIENRFPYDEMARINHMLVCRQPLVSHYEGTAAVQAEYHSIMQLLAKEGFYDAVIENFPKARSVTESAHTHLVIWHNTK